MLLLLFVVDAVCIRLVDGCNKSNKYGAFAFTTVDNARSKIVPKFILPFTPISLLQSLSHAIKRLDRAISKVSLLFLLLYSDSQLKRSFPDTCFISTHIMHLLAIKHNRILPNLKMYYDSYQYQ